MKQEAIPNAWKHYPDSPWGNVDICEHGNVRKHGNTESVCVYCDAWPDTPVLAYCGSCKATTWWIDGICHGSNHKKAGP